MLGLSMSIELGKRRYHDKENNCEICAGSYGSLRVKDSLVPTVADAFGIPATLSAYPRWCSWCIEAALARPLVVDDFDEGWTLSGLFLPLVVQGHRPEVLTDSAWVVLKDLAARGGAGLIPLYPDKATLFTPWELRTPQMLESFRLMLLGYLAVEEDLDAGTPLAWRFTQRAWSALAFPKG